MTLWDYQKQEDEYLEELRSKRNAEILSLLEAELSKHDGYKFQNVKVDMKTTENNEFGGYIHYSFELPDGFTQDDCALWKYDESIEKIAAKIVKHVAYVKKLRDDYPEYAKDNDYIQSNRDFKRSIRLTTGNVYLCAKLCGYLKLPNETECSFGGGDYEIKRTPKRVSDFNQNIDSLCLFLAGCIGDLQKLKRE